MLHVTTSGDRARRAAVAVLLLASVLTILPGGGPAQAAPPDGPDHLADFETGLPPGWFTFFGGSTVAAAPITVSDADALARPGQAGDNGILEVAFNVFDFGGLGADFVAPGAQDWSTTDGFGFWFYGSGSGLTYQAEISENRSNPGSDTSERWDYEFTDTAPGWQRISIPWADFTRATDFQPGGAPDDGLTLTEVWAWAIVLPAGVDTVYFDNFTLERVTVDTFEGPLASGIDTDGNDIGFVTFQDPNSTVAFGATDAPPAPVPGSPAVNHVLQVDTDVNGNNGFAGIIHAFENPAVDTWVPQDWSRYSGISFWLYGNNTGSVLFIDILDNRAAGTTSDTAERYSLDIIDDFSGWRFFEVPFADLNRKEVGNDAPNDGLTLTQVHGWAFGVFDAGQAFTNYIDDVALYGVADIPELAVAFAANDFEIAEGASGEITVQLNRALGAEDPAQVSVAYSVETIVPEPGKDYEPVAGGTLTFAGATTAQTFTIQTLDDTKYEGTERLILRLSNPVDVALGAVLQASASIIDDDPYDPFLLDDYERGLQLWTLGAGVAADIVEIAAGDPDAVPGQGAFEKVLSLVADGPGGGSLHRDFALGQDWSETDAIRFWFNGAGTGDDVTVHLFDNRAPDPGPAGWTMVWSDEFDDPAGTPPNPANWGYELGDGTVNGIPGWGNQELQYYTDSTDNAATDGAGNLVITAREASGLDCYYGPCDYSSARLVSTNRAEFAYGRIESRILVPDGGPGLWPAFWSLGTDIEQVGWPETGEIDIMEYVSRIPDEIFGTIHGPGYSGGLSYGNTYPFPGGVSTDYHTFAIEWQPDLIEWYVDGILYHTATPGDVDPNDWVFNDPVYLLLNLAIGGNFGGAVAETTVFPQEMKVDYVRVYQGSDTAERWEASFVDDVAGWHEVVIPFGSFARSATQPAGAPDDGLGLTDVWGYGFELAESTLNAGPVHVDQVRLVPLPPPTEIVVTNLNNSGAGSLRSALEKIADGGTITFDPSLAGGTITLRGPLVAGRPVTVDGSDAPGLAVDGGGGDRVLIVDPGGPVTLRHLTLSGGFGWQLAGCVLNNGDLTLDHVTVTGCVMGTDAGDFWQGGGGIYTGGGASLHLVDSSVTGNTAAWSGGGIYGFFGSTTVVERTTINGNVSNDVGGGIRSLGNATIVNSTISGNQSTGWYGGALFMTDGVIDLTNVTIADNISPEWAPAAVFVGTFGPGSATLNVTNTIVAGNVTEGCFLAPFGPGPVAINSLGSNVFQDATCFAVGGDQIVPDAGLEPLADNGGPTPTHALVSGSPAIDAGDAAACPATDQRGVERPQIAGCDAGAYEWIDTAPPELDARLVGVRVGTFTGLWRVHLTCEDDDPNVVVDATLNGVPVVHGQVLYLLRLPGRQLVLNLRNWTLIKAPDFRLDASCVDGAGNTSADSDTPEFRSRLGFGSLRSTLPVEPREGRGKMAKPPGFGMKE